MDDELESRLAAVERAVTDSDTPVRALDDAAAIDDRLATLEATVDALEADVAELDAAVQAVRGYAGAIRAVNEDVEARADLALAKVEALEPDSGNDRSDIEPGTDGQSPNSALAHAGPQTQPSDEESVDAAETATRSRAATSGEDRNTTADGLVARLRNAL